MNRSRTSGVLVRYRLGVFSRVLAATLGGYVVASLMSVALALSLPLLSGASRADAVMVATMLSFLVYTVVALWVFCARSAWRAWIGLGGVAVFMGLLVLNLRAAA